MADYTVTLDADFSQVFAGFAKVGQTAKQTGDQVGKGLSDGLITANANIDALKAQIRSLVATRATFKVDSAEFKTAQQQIDLLQGKLAQARSERLRLQVDSNSITAITDRLQADLNRLQQRQIAVNVDDGEFVTLGREIDRVQQELATLDRKRLIVAVDDKSVSALQFRLQELQQKQTRISVDSAEFRTLQTEAEKVQAELTAIERKRVLINVDSNSITAVTTRLQGELERLQQRQLKVNVDSKEFVTLGQQINQVQEQLSQVERKKLLIGVDAGSVVALQSKLQDLQQKQIKLSVDSAGFRTLETEINKAQQELADFGRRKLLLNVDPNSITAATAKLQAELERLQQRQVRINVNSREFDALGLQIQQTEAELQALERRRLSIGVDSNSITSLQVRLGELTQQLNRVAIGSQRFRELQGEIEATKRQLDRAGESADGFRLIDGVVQGVAFSLSNAVVNAAGAAFQALQSVVMSYAKLDTELRQAAAADGGAGAYDKIAASVDRVGIEAAGTTQEVAQLATELVRGGMSADQVNASLGAIVRGAEATGTAYAAMGSNVSAALKGFGLPASQATRVVDALVTGANASATSVQGMGMAFKYAAPVAKILGVSIEDLGIAVGLLTNAGIDASEAGVTLRNGLSKLASAAPQAAGSTQKLSGQAADAARAMRTLGVNIYNADGTLRPMRETLLALKGAFDKLGPSAKIRLAASMFGGEDDGTKWLALLNQSNEEISKMADTMANTGGATDKARNAMQGFELLIKQVDGTLGSLGNVLGKVTVAALTPFVEIANGALGILSGLPQPVKDTAAGFVLLTGGIIAATAATVIYQRFMASAIGQKALAEVVALAGAFRETLSKGISTAAARLPALIGGVANLALRMGYLIIAFKTIEAITGGSSRVGQGFEDRLKETQKALDGIAPAADKAGRSLAGMTKVSGVEKFRQDMNGILNFIANFSNAADLNTMRSQTEKLQGAFTQVQDSALRTFQALKNATALTGEQRKDINDRVNALKVVKEQADGQAKAYRDLAASYKAAGKNDMAEIATANANAMQVEVDTSTRLIAGLEGIQSRTEGVNVATSQSVSLTEQLTAATRERAQAEQAVGKIDNRLAVGQQLLNLAQAIGQVEQSRFAVSRSALDFELQQAEKRGASEQTIQAIKDRAAANDRAALQARYLALQQEQALQVAMLELTQQKARAEANLEVLDARSQRIELERELSKAASEEEKAKINAQITLQDQLIAQRQVQFDLLAQTQPLEQAALGYQQEAARNGMQAEAAATGYRFALDGSLQPANALVELQKQISVITGASADDQRRYADLAQQAGIAMGRTKDGAIVLGRTQQDVNAAVAEMNRQIAGAQGAFDKAGKGASDTKGAVDGINSGLNNAKSPANALAGAFATTGNKAPAIAQGSRDFAAYLSQAGSFGAAIANLNLDRRMGAVASETSKAATAAQSFYRSLQAAADLPGARWSGGPVEAGQEYRINELGQEAFLSAGHLSLIDAPANSIWRAPSPGVVIPAGVTARLQAQGRAPVAVSAAGGGAGVAELAIEVGKLRQEVGNLARRDWSVRVTQRTGPTGSQVMRTLLG